VNVTTSHQAATATLHDGSTLDVQVHGDGPAVLLPVNPHPVTGEKAEQLRQYGTDPDLGPSLIRGLQDSFRVVAFDYEGHLFGTPKPETLTPENVAADLLTVADAAGAHRFAYYGYSWLAMVGLQLALRTDRLRALAMGGYPPLSGPYREMLRVTTAGNRMAGGETPEMPEAPPTLAADESGWSAEDSAKWSASGLSKAQTRQFVTLYEALQDFDDRAAQSAIRCPRLCFAGARDEVEYGPEWGGVRVSLVRPLVERRAELEALGWEVRVLDGLDHSGAMHAARVLPLLRPWLTAVLLPSTAA
jgi:pimeloyl-ACP methyl ester carboxylesterase